MKSRIGISDIVVMAAELFKTQPLEECKRQIRKLLENSSDAEREGEDAIHDEKGRVLVKYTDTDVMGFKTYLTAEGNDEILQDYEGDLLINKEGRCGTLLMEAVRADRRDVVEWLIQEEDAKVNRRTDLGTPLYLACIKGQDEMIKTLIKNGADVNKGYRYESLISAAAQHGHIGCAKLLAERGARREYIATPINQATIDESAAIIKRHIELYYKLHKVDSAKKEGVKLSNNSSSFWWLSDKTVVTSLCVGAVVTTAAAVATLMRKN